MAGPVVYRVHDLEIHKFVEPGGEVNDLLNKITYSGMMFAKANAPVRTGALLGNIRYARAAARGMYDASGYIYANIGYAYYVEKGTLDKTPIRSTSGKKLKFLATKSKRPGTFVYRDWVKGQKGQHFMENGMQSAMRLHT